MKALVTGGTGFIGSHVVRELLTHKIPVRCLIRAASVRSNLSGLEVEYLVGDLQDAGSLKLALKDCDRLFHVAADYRLWSLRPEELERTNVEGTRALLAAAGDAGLKKIVYTSSVAAVGRPSSPSSGLRTPPPFPPLHPGGPAKASAAGSRERVSASPSPYLREKGQGDEGGLGHEDLDRTPAQLSGPYRKSKFPAELI